MVARNQSCCVAAGDEAVFLRRVERRPSHPVKNVPAHELGKYLGRAPLVLCSPRRHRQSRS